MPAVEWVPDNDEVLRVAWSHSTVLWPWVGYIAVEISVARRCSRVEGGKGSMKIHIFRIALEVEFGMV